MKKNSLEEEIKASNQAVNAIAIATVLLASVYFGNEAIRFVHEQGSVKNAYNKIVSDISYDMNNAPWGIGYK